MYSSALKLCTFTNNTIPNNTNPNNTNTTNNTTSSPVPIPDYLEIIILGSAAVIIGLSKLSAPVTNLKVSLFCLVTLLTTVALVRFIYTEGVGIADEGTFTSNASTILAFVPIGVHTVGLLCLMIGMLVIKD